MKAVLAISIIATMLACSRALQCYHCQDRQGGGGSPGSGYEDHSCDPGPFTCRPGTDTCETTIMSYTVSVEGDDRNVNWVVRGCMLSQNIGVEETEYCDLHEGMAGTVQGASMSGFSCSLQLCKTDGCNDQMKGFFDGSDAGEDADGEENEDGEENGDDGESKDNDEYRLSSVTGLTPSFLLSALISFFAAANFC